MHKHVECKNAFQKLQRNENQVLKDFNHKLYFSYQQQGCDIDYVFIKLSNCNFVNKAEWHYILNIRTINVIFVFLIFVILGLYVVSEPYLFFKCTIFLRFFSTARLRRIYH